RREREAAARAQREAEEAAARADREARESAARAEREAREDARSREAAGRESARRDRTPSDDTATTVLPVISPDAVATRAHERPRPAELARLPDDATRELSLADELFSMSPDDDEDEVDEPDEGRPHGWFSR
ncbi:hypothetical protein G9H71_20290, partial [Motilibacter sp. E257]